MLPTVAVYIAIVNVAFAAKCNVLDYGAIGDGITDDTISIQKAMNDTNCTTVEIPSSYNFLTYPLWMVHNNTHLFIDSNSSLNAYAANLTNWPHIGDKYVNFINAYNLTNISIYGNGLINGNGPINFYPLYKNRTLPYKRPMLIYFYMCTNMAIYNVTMLDAAMYFLWTEPPCKNLKIGGVNITSPGPGTAPNTGLFFIHTIYNCTSMIIACHYILNRWIRYWL